MQKNFRILFVMTVLLCQKSLFAEAPPAQMTPEQEAYMRQYEQQKAAYEAQQRAYYEQQKAAYEQQKAAYEAQQKAAAEAAARAQGAQAVPQQAAPAQAAQPVAQPGAPVQAAQPTPAQTPTTVQAPAAAPTTPAAQAAKPGTSSAPARASAPTRKSEESTADTGASQSLFMVRGVGRRVERLRLSGNLGVGILRGGGLALGLQPAYAIFEDVPFYVGIDATYVSFSAGSSINALAGLWYESRIYGSPRLSMGIGMLGGIALASGIAGVPSNGIAAFLDVVLSQEIDQNYSVRAQFRPGVMGPYFAYMMNLSVAYRL